MTGILGRGQGIVLALEYDGLTVRAGDRVPLTPDLHPEQAVEAAVNALGPGHLDHRRIPCSIPASYTVMRGTQGHFDFDPVDDRSVYSGPIHHSIFKGIAMAVKGTITAIKDRVFVTDLDSGDKLSTGGIIIMDDDRTDRGIRDRWARVYLVGPDVDDLKKGDWILIKHGRWTPGVKIDTPEDGEIKVWLIEYPEAVIVAADEDPRRTTVTTRTR